MWNQALQGLHFLNEKYMFSLQTRLHNSQQKRTTCIAGPRSQLRIPDPELHILIESEVGDLGCPQCSQPCNQLCRSIWKEKTKVKTVAS